MHQPLINTAAAEVVGVADECINELLRVGEARYREGSLKHHRLGLP